MEELAFKPKFTYKLTNSCHHAMLPVLVFLKLRGIVCVGGGDTSLHTQGPQRGPCTPHLT